MTSESILAVSAFVGAILLTRLGLMTLLLRGIIATREMLRHM